MRSEDGVPIRPLLPPVSYTHLDVYKRQGFKGAELLGRATDVFVGGKRTLADGVVC